MVGSGVVSEESGQKLDQHHKSTTLVDSCNMLGDPEYQADVPLVERAEVALNLAGTRRVWREATPPGSATLLCEPPQ